MRQFNHQYTTCYCTACLVGGRATKKDIRYFQWAADRTKAGLSRKSGCDFQPKWEEYLKSIGATVSDEQCKETTFYDYNGDWVFSGYGSKLSSLESPRRAVWEKLRQDYGGEDVIAHDSDEEFYAQDEQVWPV
jgi:hypothetical protein